MNIVKNLRINKKAKCLNKKTALKIAGLITTGIILSSIPMGINAHNKYMENKQINTIVAYYGEDSIENKIIEYIELAEELNKLNLQNYNIEESLYQKHNISSELKSPEEINEYINKFKNVNSYVSSKDVTKQSQNIEIILTLTLQEKLVNSYIYNVGYSTANKNITSATKKYAAEVFGIEDPANVYFNYHIDSSGESNTRVANRYTTKYGLTENETYNFDNINQKKEEKYINKGVISMTQTDVSGDQISKDNDKYNSDRNDRIKEALANSANLENQVEDYDLYNEKLANKMK